LINLSKYLYRENLIYNTLFIRAMNPKLFLMAVAVIAAFGILATITVGPISIATPALAQNMTDMGNMTGGNMTGGNMTSGLTG
jgi:hypothetical protein